MRVLKAVGLSLVVLLLLNVAYLGYARLAQPDYAARVAAFDEE